MGAAQVQYKVQRKYPRYTCELGIEVRVGDAKTGYWGTVADICLGGCYVNTFSPLPAGTSVVVLIKGPNGAIEITAKTVTFHPGLGMGIEFLGYVNPDGEAHLKSLLGELALAQAQPH